MKTSGFHFDMIRRLVLKDFYLHRGVMAFLLLFDAYSVLIADSIVERPFFDFPEGLEYFASGELSSLVLFVGLHAAMISFLEDGKTASFIRSLPITLSDYTAAKLSINLLLLLPAWTTVMVREVLVVQRRADVPDGLIPYFVLSMLASFFGFCLVLGVATIRGSRGWTFLLLPIPFVPAFFPSYLDRMPAIRRAVLNDSAVWTPVELGILVLLLAAIGLTFFLIFHFQERRKDFTCSDF